jgi:hypothetical protein
MTGGAAIIIRGDEMIYFSDDPIKQEMLEALITELKHFDYNNRDNNEAVILSNLIERATGKSIEEVLAE